MTLILPGRFVLHSFGHASVAAQVQHCLAQAKGYLQMQYSEQPDQQLCQICQF